MFFPDFGAARRLMEMRVREHLQAVATERLLRQARSGRRSWLTWQASQALSGLGHALVTLGRWLQRYGPVPTTSAGERL